MKTIILIGTGYSGSSAIYDFLRATKKFRDPFPDKEFSISYDPGGLIDIEDKIIRARSINQVNFIIKQFQKNLYYYINEDNSIKPGKNFQNKNKIKYLFQEYINRITEFKYIGESTFMKHQGNFFSYLISKFYEKFKLKKKKEILSLVNHKEFLEETRIFLNSLFFPDEKKQTVILDQGGNITDLANSTKFYENPYIILINRDPRDIFSEFKQKVAYSYPKEDVNIFCTWYEKLMKNIDDQDFQNLNILKINFEDFVLNHKDTVKNISDFISEDISAPLDNFDLNRSKSNIMKFKNLLNTTEITTIENVLKKYLYFKKNEH